MLPTYPTRPAWVSPPRCSPDTPPAPRDSGAGRLCRLLWAGCSVTQAPRRALPPLLAPAAHVQNSLRYWKAIVRARSFTWIFIAEICARGVPLFSAVAGGRAGRRHGRGGRAGAKGDLRVDLFHELYDEVDQLVLVHALEVVVGQKEGDVVALRGIGAAGAQVRDQARVQGARWVSRGRGPAGPAGEGAGGRRRPVAGRREGARRWACAAAPQSCRHAA